MSYSVAFLISYVESSFLALRPHEIVLYGAIYFLSIYLAFACFAWTIAWLVNRPIETKKIKPTQIRTELLDSLRSILIFGIGIIIPWLMVKLNIASFPNTISVVSILTEMLILIVWNDLHFYAIHRLLHSRFKKLHSAHHLSVTATPFTAYSMSIWEAMLLGSVMPIAMLFYDFSILSLAFLPIWSIAINTMAHSNCEISPNVSEYSLLGVIRHHQNHHSKYHGNYSFFFTNLDSWFNTTQK